MTTDKTNNIKPDRLIRSALESDIKLTIPPGLSDSIIRKLEKRVILRNLILELSYKAGLVLASIAILTTIFVLFNGNSVLDGLLAHLSDNYRIVLPLLSAGIITILIDQIGLKFYQTSGKEHV